MLIAHVCQSTGWTWDYVEWNIDLKRLAALTHQWNELPPASIQLARFASYIGYKNEKQKTNNQEAEEMFKSMVESAAPISSMPKVMSPDEYLRKKNG